MTLAPTALAWCCSRAQALLCAYVDEQPEGSLSPEQLTQLAHAVRLAHLSPYFLVEVAPRVGWLCAQGRETAVRGVALARMGAPARDGTPAAWLPSAPARTGSVDPASRPVEWELPLAQLRKAVNEVAAGCSSKKELTSPCTTAAFGLGWGLMLRVALVDDSSTARPRAVKLGLYVRPHFKHVPTPPETATFRWVGWSGAEGARGGQPSEQMMSSQHQHTPLLTSVSAMDFRPNFKIASELMGVGALQSKHRFRLRSGRY
jgi:hypothetical protein